MRERYIISMLIGASIAFNADAVKANDNIIFQESNDWYVNFNSDSFLPQSLFIENQNVLSGYNRNYRFSASIGHNVNKFDDFFSNTGIKTEITFSDSSFDGGQAGNSISKIGVMANAFYNFNDKSAIQPYLGAGAGVANIAGDSGSKGTESFTLPAYQAMAGMLFQSETYPSASAHVGYQYFATIGKSEIKAVIDPSVKYSYSHNIEAGVKIGF